MSSSKKLILIALLAFGLIVGAACLARTAYTAYTNSRQQVEEVETSEEADNPEQPTQNNANPSQATRGNGTPIDNADLTEKQEKIIEEYTSSQEALIETLMATNWTNTNENIVISFSRNSFTITANSSTSTQGFAISNVDTQTSSDRKTTTAIIELSDHQSLLYVKTSSTQTTIASQLFGSEDFIPIDKVGEATLTNLDGEGAQSMKTYFSNWDSLSEQIVEWVQKNAPTTTEIKWNENVEIDYTTNEVTTSFTLNDKDKHVISVTYSNTTGELSTTQSR